MISHSHRINYRCLLYARSAKDQASQHPDGRLHRDDANAAGLVSAHLHHQLVLLRASRLRHRGQIGLEPILSEFVLALANVFREVRRVLLDDGTLWLNLSDS